MGIPKVIAGGTAALVACPALVITLATAAIAAPLLFFTSGSRS
jgi:hypothetical protein